MTVKECQEKIDAWEYYEWQCYFMQDPFGNERGDLQSAIIASTMANCHTTKGKRFEPRDFMPEFGEKKKRNVGQRLFHQLMASCRLVKQDGDHS